MSATSHNGKALTLLKPTLAQKLSRRFAPGKSLRQSVMCSMLAYELFLRTWVGFGEKRKFVENKQASCFCWTIVLTCVCVCALRTAFVTSPSLPLLAASYVVVVVYLSHSCCCTVVSRFIVVFRFLLFFLVVVVVFFCFRRKSLQLTCRCAIVALLCCCCCCF